MNVLTPCFGDNSVGEMGITATNGTGNATNNPTSCYSGVFVSTPTTPQFCTRCQREVQLGTEGTFTAQCNGTLYLYFNDAFSNLVSTIDSGAYTATVVNLANNVVVWATNGAGAAVGTVTNGGVYSYSASGYCTNAYTLATDPNGRDPNTGQLLDCSLYLNITNAVCPMWQCFSLVGRIQ